MREITGRDVLAVTVGAFSVIIAVNVLLAYKAVSTFPGLEVKSSYVASQGFDARRREQQALGWSAEARYGDGQLTVRLTDAQGLPAPVARLAVLVGRATEAKDDQTPAFTQLGGEHVAPAVLGPGKWIVRLQATALDGTLFEQRLDLQIRG